MKKLIIFGSILLILVGMYLFDYIDSKSYSYEVVSSSVTEIVADGYSPAKITVRLTKKGKPVEGHIIDIVTSNGTLKASRLVTDKNGEITFTYYSYLYLNDVLSPLTDVYFYLSDESNSKIFMVEAKTELKYTSVKPEEESVWEDWQSIVVEDE